MKTKKVEPRILETNQDVVSAVVALSVEDWENFKYLYGQSARPPKVAYKVKPELEQRASFERMFLSGLLLEKGGKYCVNRVLVTETVWYSGCTANAYRVEQEQGIKMKKERQA